MFALLDCNNFYASCERVFRPDLNTKPIVVLSNNDGCVIARSDEAKQLGIPMGAPAHQYQSLFKKHCVHVFSSNYALYGDMSARVMDLMSTFTPDIEVYSIDEAFMCFTEHDGPYAPLGEVIRKKISGSTGIPVSIGFAPNKTLAKLANRIAKKYSEHTLGVYVIDSDAKRSKALEWLKIEDVWGIGQQLANRLKQIGIHNAAAFTLLNDQWIRKEMTITGLRLKYELLGKPLIQLEKEKNKQNIACTRSFDVNYDHFESVKERVITFASICAEKLRTQNSNCNALMVFIHTNEHRNDLAQYSKNIVIPLPYPCNSNIELAKFAVFGLKYIYKKDFSYKKAGVIAMDLTPIESEQTVLFTEKNLRYRPLMKAIDKLNHKLGNQVIRIAAQSIGPTWKMKQKHRSNRYTTRLKEIITVIN